MTPPKTIWILWDPVESSKTYYFLSEEKADEFIKAMALLEKENENIVGYAKLIPTKYERRP